MYRLKIKSLGYKLASYCMGCFYLFLPFKYGLNLEEIRRHKIIVSFTSYPKRFSIIHLVVKSIAYQSMRADKIVLYLSKEECDGKEPTELDILKKYGVEIVLVNENLKPHNKYYYAMKQYPDDIIITLDDDVIYPRKLIRKLYESYEEYPEFISAARVHRIKKNLDGTLKPYNEWEYECTACNIPSNMLIATGVGGVLYPPGILPDMTFDIQNIKRLCIGADDIWLKFMEFIDGKKVVYVPGANRHIWSVENYAKEGLREQNVKNGKNDIYIQNIMEYYGILPEQITE